MPRFCCSGFTGAAAIIIASSQLGKLLKLNLERTNHVYEVWIEAGQEASDVSTSYKGYCSTWCDTGKVCRPPHMRVLRISCRVHYMTFRKRNPAYTDTRPHSWHGYCQFGPVLGFQVDTQIPHLHTKAHPSHWYPGRGSHGQHHHPRAEGSALRVGHCGAKYRGGDVWGLEGRGHLCGGGA